VGESVEAGGDRRGIAGADADGFAPRGLAANDFDGAARHFEGAREKIDQFVVGLASIGRGIERDYQAARIEANDTLA